MKKSLTLLAVTVLAVFFIVGAVGATVFSPSQSQLLGMTLAWDNGGEGTLHTGYPTAYGTGAQFVGDIFVDSGDGFYSIGIGYAWQWPFPIPSLSGCTSYELNITNINDDDWDVNLYMNTGYVDWGETNNFYQNGWATISPGQTAHLVLDFSTEGAINLNHITNLGFQIATDREFGDQYNLVASTVPIPGAIWLLGSGLFGLIGLRRKFKS
ncbi:MAG: VPLPA-CTERM sorting domain-containing protein [Deltaproteobacteria bacterium]|nr:VPLPA-CTERM sorting domain-containing protein [Deltaproteobacteria bacterium]